MSLCGLLLYCFLYNVFFFSLLLFGVGASSFQSPRSCASSIFTPFSFLYFLITPLRLSFRLSILRCLPTSMFSLLHLLPSFYPSMSTHFHVLITTSSSVVLSMLPNISVSLVVFSPLCLPHLILLLFRLS